MESYNQLSEEDKKMTTSLLNIFVTPVCTYRDILPLLAIGGVDAATEQCIFENDVESVLSLGTSRYRLPPPDVPLKSYLFFQLDDSPYDGQALHDILPLCLSWIDQEIKKVRRVLVHCGAGISRSASVVVAYVMQDKQLPLQDALQFVKDRKSDIAPNSGFIEVLSKLALSKENGSLL